jgi:hypothetical protein
MSFGQQVMIVGLAALDTIIVLLRVNFLVTSESRLKMKEGDVFLRGFCRIIPTVDPKSPLAPSRRSLFSRTFLPKCYSGSVKEYVLTN